MQCAAAMHPSLKELVAKVAEARKKEHKPKLSLKSAWPESLRHSLEPQIKQQQEQAQKLETWFVLHGMVASSHALSNMESAAAMPTNSNEACSILFHGCKWGVMHSLPWREQRSLQHFLPTCGAQLSCNPPIGNTQQLCISPAW